MQTPYTHRINVTEETRDRLRDFADGAGITYDDAINFLLDKYAGHFEVWQAGRENRDAIQEHVSAYRE